MSWIGLEVTTYEISGQEYLPTLSHVFWGKTLEKCVQVAKSHMVTDVFFTSSFLGEMPWKDSVLKLANDGKVVGIHTFTNSQELDNIMRSLNQHASKVGQLHAKEGTLQVVQRVAKQLPK